jgi:hypothetical protein
LPANVVFPDAVHAHEQRHPRLLGPGRERRVPGADQRHGGLLQRRAQVERAVLVERLPRLGDQPVGRGRANVRRQQGELELLDGGRIERAPAQCRAHDAGERVPCAREPAPEPIPKAHGGGSGDGVPVPAPAAGSSPP